MWLKIALLDYFGALGIFFMLLAASKAGLAIAFSFSQLGAIISIVGGILFLGETKTKKRNALGCHRNYLFYRRCYFIRCGQILIAT